MELDELKQAWKQTEVKTNINTDIMELLQHKSYGPVAAMKRVFRKQIMAMTALPFILILTNVTDIHAVLTSIMFWSYVAFCIGIIIFASYNYRIVRQMEAMDGIVKANLERQISLLEKRASWELIGMRGVMLFFIALTEIVPYFQHYRTLALWHSMPVIFRIATYAALLLLQYFFNRKIKERNVGQHLTYLKKLVKEMQ
jgi:lipid-A-disaccharide synthase-like uncharacterized protein